MPKFLSPVPRPSSAETIQKQPNRIPSGSGLRSAINSKTVSRNREVPRNKRSRKGANSVPYPQRDRIKRRFISGENISQIAREEKRHWETVARIVREEDVQKHVKNLQARFYGAMEDVLKETLVAIKVKNDGWLGFEMLDRAGVIPQWDSKSKVELSLNRPPATSDEALQREIGYGLINAAIEQHKYFELPLPEAEEMKERILAKRKRGD